MSSPKVIAMYLPQYHCIPENDKFWGKGFTDWQTVRNAKPLYNGHIQPRVPLNENYYDLSTKKDVVWQAKLAKEYGVYGFGIYHYWFNNDKNLLTKPVEIIYKNPEIDINYFFAWDNASWIRSWSNVLGNAWAPIADKSQMKNQEPEILIEHILGGKEDWKNHFSHLLPYFRDSRYVKIDNKPVFIVWRYNTKIEKMGEYWDELAKLNGFNGIYIIVRYGKGVPNYINQLSYEPINSGWLDHSFIGRVRKKLARDLRLTFLYSKPKGYQVYDYDIIWNKILEFAKTHPSFQIHQGCFVAYDDTPRRGISNGIIVKGATPDKFRDYMIRLLSIVGEQKKDFVFLTAWNEWGEGAFLEPDIINKYGYLEALKDALIYIKNEK